MPPKVGVGVSSLVLRDDRLLMILRKGSHGKDKWSVPGGWVEPGETLGQAAVRELEEEMAITLPVLGILTYTEDHHPFSPGETQVHDVCFHIAMRDTADRQTPKIMEPDKIGDFCWASKVAVTQLLGQEKLFLPLELLINHYGVIGLWEELRMDYTRRGSNS